MDGFLNVGPIQVVCCPILGAGLVFVGEIGRHQVVPRSRFLSGSADGSHEGSALTYEEHIKGKAAKSDRT